MPMFKKGLTSKIIACSIGVIFIFNTTSYSMGMPQKTFLRKPLDFNNPLYVVKERWHQATDSVRATTAVNTLIVSSSLKFILLPFIAIILGSSDINARAPDKVWFETTAPVDTEILSMDSTITQIDEEAAYKLLTEGTYNAKLQFLLKMSSVRRQEFLKEFFKRFNQKNSSEVRYKNYVDDTTGVKDILNGVHEMSGWVVRLFQDLNVPDVMLADFEEVLNTNVWYASYYPGTYFEGDFRYTSLSALQRLVPYYESLAKNPAVTPEERSNAIFRLKMLYSNYDRYSDGDDYYSINGNPSYKELAKKVEKALERLATSGFNFARKFFENRAREEKSLSAKEALTRIAKERGDTPLFPNLNLTINGEVPQPVPTASDSLPPLTAQQILSEKLGHIFYNDKALDSLLKNALENKNNAYHSFALLIEEMKNIDSSGFWRASDPKDLFLIAESPEISKVYLETISELARELGNTGLYEHGRRYTKGFARLAKGDSVITAELVKQFKEKYNISYSWLGDDTYPDGLNALGRYAASHGGIEVAIAYFEQLKAVIDSSDIFENIIGDTRVIDPLNLVGATPEGARRTIEFVKKYFCDDEYLSIRGKDLEVISPIADKPLPDEAFMDELKKSGYRIRDILDIPVLYVISQSPTGRNLFLHPKELLTAAKEFYLKNPHVDYYFMENRSSVEELALADRMLLIKSLLIWQLMDEQLQNEIGGMIQEDLNTVYSELGGHLYYDIATKRLVFDLIPSLETTGKTAGNERYIQRPPSKTMDRKSNKIWLSTFHFHAVDPNGNQGNAVPSGGLGGGDLWQKEDGLVITNLPVNVGWQQGMPLPKYLFDIDLYGHSRDQAIRYITGTHVIDLGAYPSINPIKHKPSNPNNSKKLPKRMPKNKKYEQGYLQKLLEQQYQAALSDLYRWLGYVTIGVTPSLKELGYEIGRRHFAEIKFLDASYVPKHEGSKMTKEALEIIRNTNPTAYAVLEESIKKGMGDIHTGFQNLMLSDKTLRTGL